MLVSRIETGLVIIERNFHYQYCNGCMNTEKKNHLKFGITFMFCLSNFKTLTSYLGKNYVLITVIKGLFKYFQIKFINNNS